MIGTDEEIKKLIGSKIKFYRKCTMHMSREKFVENVTEHFTTIDNIEVGRSFPNIDFMVSLSNKYKVSINTFMDTGFEFGKLPKSYEVIQDFEEEEQYRIIRRTNVEKYHCLQAKYTEQWTENTHMKSTMMENIGRNIHNERIKKSYSIEYLMKETDMTQKTLMNLERGHSGISMLSLYRICCAIRVPVDYILVEELQNKETAIQYLFYDTFHDTDRKEEEFLTRYMEIYGEYIKNCIDW